MRLLIPVWLMSLAGAFHLGWWGRWRINQKLKKTGTANIENIRSAGGSHMLMNSVLMKYWEML